MSSTGNLVSWSLRDWHHVNEVASAVLSLAFNAILSWLLIREKDETIKPYSRVLLQNCLVDICVEVDKGHYIHIVNGCLRFLPQRWHYALSAVHLTCVMLTVLIVPVEFVFRYLFVCKSVTLSTKQIYYMGAVTLSICAFCSSFAGLAFTLDSEAGGDYDHHAVDIIWPREGNETVVVLWASTKDPFFVAHIALTMFAEGVAYALMIATSIATYRAIRKQKSRMSQKTLDAQRQMNRILITEASSVFIVGILPVICIFTMLFLGVSAVGYGTVLTMIHVWVPLLNPCLLPLGRTFALLTTFGWPMDIVHMALAAAGFEHEDADEHDIDDVLDPAQLQAQVDAGDVEEDDVNDVLAPAQAPAQADAEVTKPFRRRPAVIHDGYTYIVKSKYKDTTYWRCIFFNKENCRAKAKSDRDSTVLTITNGGHNHGRDYVRQIIAKVKQQAHERVQTGAATIVDEAMLGLDPEVALAINRNNLLRVANREKRSDGSAQLNRPLADIVWPEAFTVTAGIPAEPFLIYDSRQAEPGDSVIFIFASPAQLRQLHECAHWSADGTFWCTPRLFDQLYTVHANIGTSSVPAAYILMQDRLEATYKRALRALVRYGGLEGVEPRTVMHDFELAAISAFKDVFSDSALRLCLFHLAQAVWRNIAEHGLTRLYKENKKVRELLRSFAALAIVPPTDVVQALDLIVAELQRLLYGTNEIPMEFEQGLMAFLDYFEKTYVRRLDRRGQRFVDPRFKPALWNCYQAVLQGLHRTNNCVEGWHFEFNRTFPRAHMALDKFVQRLQMDESKNRQRLERHEFYQADPLRNKRKPGVEASDKHILAIVQKYATHYLPSGQVLRYLRCMQYHLSQADYDDRDENAEAPAEGQNAEAAAEAVADDSDDDDTIPLNESHPDPSSDDEAMDFDTPPGPVSRSQTVAAAAPVHRRGNNDMMPGFSQATARPAASKVARPHQGC